MKRADYISWDQCFMGIALLSAERSKDPSTQVGACIVDDNNRILSEGYNGMPAGCEDDIMPWVSYSRRASLHGTDANQACVSNRKISMFHTKGFIRSTCLLYHPHKKGLRHIFKD